MQIICIESRVFMRTWVHKFKLRLANSRRIRLPSLIGITLVLWFLNCFILCLAMPCRNICTRIGSSFGYYSAGIKYCRRCEIYLFHDAYICPCCKRPLRTSPNNRRGKEKLCTRQAIQQSDSNIIKTLEGY